MNAESWTTLIVALLATFGMLIGIWVRLNSRIVNLENDGKHFQKDLQKESEARKSEIENLAKETREDRKLFQAHAKETSDALHELGRAVHGLTIFLKGTIEERPVKKRKSLEVDA
jgi:HAMP domain-containing protein